MKTAPTKTHTTSNHDGFPWAPRKWQGAIGAEHRDGTDSDTDDYYVDGEAMRRWVGREWDEWNFPQTKILGHDFYSCFKVTVS